MAELNPSEIGGNITTELGNIVQGDIEIAGRKIPKIAVIGGGAGLIVLLFLLTKRSGGSASKSAFLGTANASSLADTGNGGFGTTDTPVGGVVKGDQSPTDLQGVVDSSIADTQTDFQNQLSGLQDQLSNLDLSYPVSALPTDVGTLPYYNDTSSFSEPSYGYQGGGSSNFNESSYGVSSNPITTSQRAAIPVIKPSSTKENGGVVKPSASDAKLGVASTKKDSRGSDLVSQLGNAPKLSAAGTFKPSAVTGLNKGSFNIPKPSAVKPNTVNPFISTFPGNQKKGVIVTPQAINKQGSKPTITPQKTSYSGVPSASAKKPPIVASNALFDYLSGKVKAVPKPIAVKKQPPKPVVSKTPQKTTYNPPKATPKIQPYNAGLKYGVKKNK